MSARGADGQDDASNIAAGTMAPRVARSTGRRLHGAIARKLGIAIVSGQFPPGSALPSEVVFAEELEVSRSAFREAIQALTAKGLVTSRPKAGTRVSPRERWNLLDPDVLTWAFAGEPDAELVRNLFELRAIIEPAAARLAAGRRDKAELKTMRDALAVMRRDTLTSEAGRTADREFHAAILHATGNAALIVLGAGIGAAVTWTTLLKQRARALPRNPLPDHVAVYEAIAAQDGDAAERAMRTLIERAFDDVRDALAPDQAAIGR